MVKRVKPASLVICSATSGFRPRVPNPKASGSDIADCRQEPTEVAYIIAEEDVDSEEPIQEEAPDAEGVIDSAIEKMAEIEIDESKEEE